MRHAIAAVAGLSLAVAAAPSAGAQEPANAAPSPAAAQSAAPSNVKVAGKDVPVPRRTRSVQPIYPPEAQALGQRGIVILELFIDESGKVATADVLRSVPPFDEAALLAARQWVYEVTKVDGRPVPVRLTVPITFALRLPDMTRESGIPELRQGAASAFPAGGQGPATVVADVTLHPDGTVAEAAILEGDSPWAEAMLQMLRTWRFAAEPGAGPIAFKVRAQYLPGPPPRVDLRLSGLHPAERSGTMTMEAAPVPEEPVPAPTTDPPAAVAEAEPAEPTAPADPEPTPADPRTSPPSAPATPPDIPTAPPAASGAEGPAPETAAPQPPPAADPSPAATPPSPAPVPTPPPVEVIPGGVLPGGLGGTPPGALPPPPPPEPGISAVRDVSLGAGVPDLTKGRRPVAPPLARMSSVSGSVKVQFSVDAAGSASVQQVNGPELLREAARQAVSTWSFRRTSPDRVYLVAVFSYEGDRAEAEVTRAE
ncbi:MAG TPA: TonB family protein [Vicinamibacteria bacterium]|nr:TonB family protein [Vicinamibacteria bacterium]